MPLTTVDPKPALVVVDLQKGVLGVPTAHPTEDVLARSARLADAFRAHGHPVALVNVGGRPPGRNDSQATAAPAAAPADDWAELAPELATSDDDIRVTKQRWGAFHGTELDRQLRDREVTQLFLTGISTSIGVESTARSALDLGYHVVLVTDAMTDRDPAAHDHSLSRIFPRLGETATTDEVLAALS